MRNLDTIQLRELEVDCIIGVNPAERTQPQRLRVQLELHVETDAAARSEQLEETVDYEFVAAQIQFVLHLGQFHLLEAACHAICRTLLLPPIEGERRAAIQGVSIRIEKPDALGGRAVPCLQLSRIVDDVSFRMVQCPFGPLHVVHETPNVGIVRLSLAPGGRVPLHMHRVIQEAEMLLTDGIQVQGVAGPRGSTRLWPKYFPHGYFNSTSRTQGILRLCRPRCCGTDEVLVEGQAAPIVAYSPMELGARPATLDWPSVN